MQMSSRGKEMKSEAASAWGTTTQHMKGLVANTGNSLSGPQGMVLRKEILQVCWSPFFHSCCLEAFVR